MYNVTNESTIHGLNTPYGLNTPHRSPTFNQYNIADALNVLAIDLYPTGRAFTMPKDGIGNKIHSALNNSYLRLINSAFSILNSNLPENEGFDEDDCLLWEYRLGLRTNETNTIEQRKNTILRKISRGRNAKARQSLIYIQYQLRLAGYNVYLHENTFPYRSPEDIIAGSSNTAQHQDSNQHGQGSQHGATSIQLIANSSAVNEVFSVNNLNASFFIGGEILGTSAVITANRQEEFRELVLKLKPAHLVAYTFINYN